MEARKKSEPCPTVEEIALQVYEGNKGKWKEGGKHRDQWINSLRHDVFPIIGSMAVKDVRTKDLIDVFDPIWTIKDETARRLKQRLEKIFKRAKALGHLDRDLPTEGLVEALPTQEKKKRHHPAIPYEQVGSFIATLRTSPSSLVVKLAFEFLILTATRTSDVLGMQYSEIDGNVWTIPATRHKTKEKFRVPLTADTLSILNRARSLNPEQRFVFPGRSHDQPLSNMAFLMVLDRMGLRDGFVPHGFRSAFKDWASEQTPFTREVTEMALSHRIKDKTEEAYRRRDLLEKRRPLMEAWSAYALAGRDAGK